MPAEPGRHFFDSNTLLYLISEDTEKARRVERHLYDRGCISVQVLNEFANVARRKLRRSWPEIMTALKAIRVLCPSPRPITMGTHEAALAIAARSGYQLYDALIIAAALEAGCSTLFSEDLQDGQVIGGRLTIQDPFR